MTRGPAPRRAAVARGRAARPWRLPWSVPVQRAVVVALALFIAQRAWVGVHRAGDFRLYTWTGEAALARGDLYHGCPYGACTWPPVFSLGCIPLALLERWSDTGARAVWMAVNAAALAAILVLLSGWADRRPWSWWPRSGTRSPGSASVLVPLLIAGRFLLVNLEFLQVNLLILFLEVLGLWWIARGRERAGGSVIGLAGACKVLPALLVPWLFWRGQRRAAIAAAAAGIVFTLLPGFHFGWGVLRDLLLDWPRAVRGDWGVNGPNQSVYAMADRFLGHGVTLTTAVHWPFDYVPPSGLAVSGWVAAGAAACAVAVARIGWRRPLRLVSVAGLAEAGAVLAASVLFAPLAWVHYFVVMLVPVAAVWAALERGRLSPRDRAVVTGLLAAAVAIIWLTARAIAGPRLAKIGLSLSDLTLAGLLLAGCSGWVAARARG